MIVLLVIVTLGVLAYGYLWMARIDRFLSGGGFVSDEEYERQTRCARAAALAELNGAPADGVKIEGENLERGTH